MVSWAHKEGVEEMEIKKRIIGNVAILDVKGEIIGDDRLELNTAVWEEFDLEREGIILNLEECPMGDGGGFGMLVAAHTQLLKKGAKLVLLNVNNSLRYLLKVTRFKDLFEKYDDEDEALESFTAKEGVENRQGEWECTA